MLSSTVVAVAVSNSGHHSKVGFVVFGIVASLIGLLHLAKPDATWRMSRWQYRNKDALAPSHAGLIAIRAGGAVALVIGIVFLVLGITG